MTGLFGLRAATRREFLRGAGTGLGAVALQGLLAADDHALGRGSGDDARRLDPLGARVTPLAARAKSVILLHMAGSPPQQDLYDPKPILQRLDGTPAPPELFEGKRLAFTRGHPKLLGSPHGFRRHGQLGLELSELLPYTAQVVDRLCIVRSMVTEEFNHAPAQLLLYTGSSRFGSASLGSWVTYGLGSECDDLPGFVVMVSGGTDPSGGKSLWGSGFLPPVYQGRTPARAG